MIHFGTFRLCLFTCCDYITIWIFTYHHSASFFTKVAPIPIYKCTLKLLGTYLSGSVTINSTKPLGNAWVYLRLLTISSRCRITTWWWRSRMTTLWGSASRIPPLRRSCSWIAASSRSCPRIATLRWSCPRIATLRWSCASTWISSLQLLNWSWISI